MSAFGESSQIENVSDTALWVAVYRAQENLRSDALFRDPLASVLAGERGQRIAEGMASMKLMAWAMAMRTSAIDRLVLRAVELGVDTVINLGAGLDTRPYRMKALPASLRWVEVDFPHMIEHKNTKLAGEKPVCRLERIPLDLADRGARAEMLARLAGESRSSVLVITEGVIPYLEIEAVRELAQDLHAQSRIRFWIQDYAHGGHAQRVRRKWTRKLKMAPFKFQVPDWFVFFEAFGWRKFEAVSAIGESERVGRRPPFVFPMSLLWIARYLFTTPNGRKRQRELMGYALLERK